MLATLVIGLREGLEASLIVGIIAAFLSRTGKPLRPMWIGVGIAVALSVAVGVILQLVSASLPQAAQEAMESIIGLVAVAIVTGMIGWMNTHARNMKSELEHHAADAIKDGTAWALVGMAFLAVLKEGFETSVFLLAAFQSSTSVVAAGAGAVIGIAIAVAIGIGIFRGGIRINLGRFFRITGLVLVFIAAGLVLTSLRTAHEAGWINIGQTQVLDITWIAPLGSVQSALLTGVLGIPADPRVIEVLGWVAYIIPMLAYLLWPAKRRPKGHALQNFRATLAAVLVLAAAVLAVAITLPAYQAPTKVNVVASDGTKGTATLTTTGTTAHYATTLDKSSGGNAIDLTGPTVQYDGVTTRTATRHSSSGASANEPSTVTLTQLVTLNGGRLPIGISPTDDPGPFTVKWTNASTTTVWVSGTGNSAGIVDAHSSSTTIATLTGGGLPSSRTLTPAAAQTPGWHILPAERASTVNGILNAEHASSELMLWKLWLPLALVITAVILLGYALRGYLPTGASGPNGTTSPRVSPTPAPGKSKEYYA